ncbi:ion channel [Deinococcus radiomollis]|uniref:ion channel n=1 Tax=Deinococcus radiomollis TaxID=468916 RepID=UPI0038921BDD
MTRVGRGQSAGIQSAGIQPVDSARPLSLPDLNADLGLGGAVAEGSAERFLNRDGTFNVRRQHIGLQGVNLYGELLTVSWGRFFVLLALAYMGLNATFAAAYDVLGSSALSQMPPPGLGRFLACFFFSVQTFGTIGFGHIYPRSVAADWVVTAEAFVGLLGVALATGILFARFSRPSHRVLFSESAVIAPYQGAQALMFRVMNGHRTQLIDLSAEVTFSHFENVMVEGLPGTSAELRRIRRFYPLSLERSRVTFFPTSWTIVHPILPESPLWGQSGELLEADDAELLVVLRATDDASQQSIHARSSYKASEMVWNARFRPIHSKDNAGHLRVDVARLSHIERVATGESAAP